MKFSTTADPFYLSGGEVNAPEVALLHAVLSSFVAGTCNILFLRTMHDIQDVQELIGDRRRLHPPGSHRPS